MTATTYNGNNDHTILTNPLPPSSGGGGNRLRPTLRARGGDVRSAVPVHPQPRAESEAGVLEGHFPGALARSCGLAAILIGSDARLTSCSAWSEFVHHRDSGGRGILWCRGVT